jgi:predicted transcriptional regulator
MKANIENTTVKDISHLINAACLRADCETSLEQLAEKLCASNLYKVYLENGQGELCGVIQAKQIALEMLKFSRQKSDERDMLPAIAYVLNYHSGESLSEPPVTVRLETTLATVLKLMNQNSIREIAVVDENNRMIGTLEAKHILLQYLQAKTDCRIDAGERK